MVFRSRRKIKYRISKNGGSSLSKVKRKTSKKDKFKSKKKGKKNNKSSGDILGELLLLKSNLLALFIMAKDIVLKYYPDVDVPKNNMMIFTFMKIAKSIQGIICDATGTTQQMFCESLNNETPKNVKELICKNTEILTELNCNNIKNIISLFEALVSVSISDIVLGESPESTDLQEVYPPQEVYPQSRIWNKGDDGRWIRNMNN